MKPLILASESPRRSQLLKEAGFKFEVIPVKVSEIPNKNLNVNEQILDIARRKSAAAVTHFQDLGRGPALILTADTEVIFEGVPLGKPKDQSHAFEILSRLSGNFHEVLTAVCICDTENGQLASAVEKTEIYFKNLSSQEIQDYIATGEPLDKAGAYGIQGLGGKFVEKIVGPFDNVVGLPVEMVKRLLHEFK